MENGKGETNPEKMVESDIGKGKKRLKGEKT